MQRQPPKALSRGRDPRQVATYGGESGRSGRGLVIGLALLLVVIVAIKGYQFVASGASWAPPKPPARELPREPLLEGEELLEGDALQARMAALRAAVECVERSACEGVDDPGRVRARPSLPFREALRRLQKRAAAGEASR